MDELMTTPSMAEYYQMIKAEHEANNAWSAEQAQKAMDYQTEMSNTAHQREVADLKAAGLNPVLSAGGAGATTGSGIAAQRSDENVQALYGLAKQAIEANIEQAQAMANTAKAASGSSGGYRGSGGASSVTTMPEDSTLSDWLQAAGFKKNQADAVEKVWNDLDNRYGLTDKANYLAAQGVTRAKQLYNKATNGPTVKKAAAKVAAGVKNASSGNSVSKALSSVKNKTAKAVLKKASRSSTWK